jgi:hypothetical protein
LYNCSLSTKVLNGLNNTIRQCKEKKGYILIIYFSLRAAMKIYRFLIYMSLDKNLGGRVGFKENFKGGGVKFFLKILQQICENLKRSQKISEKWHFLAGGG